MAPLPTLTPAPKADDRVTIAHISDLHFTQSTDRKGRVWQALLLDLQRDGVGVDLIAVTGDVIDSSMADNVGTDGVAIAFRNVKAFLVEDLCPALHVDPDTALLVVPGNHDFGIKGVFRKQLQFDLFYWNFAKYFSSRLFPTLGLAVFVFDSNTPDRGINFATGLVKETDLIAHADTVAHVAKDNESLWSDWTRVVLLHHHVMPIAPTQHREGLLGGEEFMLLKNAGLFMEQMVKTKMDLVLHGHRHYPAYSRVSFPISEGGEHAIAIVAGGSVGKHDDYDFSYNLITIARSGEVLLERRVLRATTYERDIQASISNYETARNTRLARVGSRNSKRMHARKYARVDAIRAGSGDAVIEETFYDVQAMNEPIPDLKRSLTSKSGVFGNWQYRAPAGYKIEWNWLGSAVKFQREGHTTFDPPLGKIPITFSRRGTTFNAIHFNQRDRLDTTDQKTREEWAEMWTRHAYDEVLFQLGFPPDRFPDDFRLEVTRPDGNRDFQEEDWIRPRLTRLANTCTVTLAMQEPIPEYSYKIVWDLPADDAEELNLSAAARGFAARMVEQLLKLREPQDPHQAAVDRCLTGLRQEILSAPAFASPGDPGELEIELMVYDKRVGGLVCAASLSEYRDALAKWVVKPGKFVVGQAFRRREDLVFINLPGLQTESAAYYEPIPGLEHLPQHTVIFSMPLFYPVRQGVRVGALSLGSRSLSSGLLCLEKERVAFLALKNTTMAWYATQLGPALGLGPLL